MTQGYTTAMYINLKTKVSWGHIEKGARWYNFRTNVEGRPQQDIDVLAVLDFQIPCSYPETLGFYLICLQARKPLMKTKTSAMTL